jgi:hypothetical protein
MNGSRTCGRTGFGIRPDRTIHLPIRVSSQLMSMIRRYHGVSVKLTAVVAGKTITQTITVKIF